MVNALGAATSPYLLQHAANPVRWQEWSEAAFVEARERNVPLFLSVGYAACHWCHVMAHESFEDEAVADILNENFVSLKVDREERPDVDAIYMEATTALTGHGGWPMSVFLDHLGRPFYAGTYFPPQPRGGLPSFKEIVLAIDRTWRERPSQVVAAAERISQILLSPQMARPEGSCVDLLGQPLLAPFANAAVIKLASQHDDIRGGFGGSPKFPPSMILDFLITNHSSTKDPTAMAMVERTCQAMARGGVYDQLGGGFARYSVDPDWVVPHFEKMLYDNALLLSVYSKLHSATGDDLALRVARETADFMMSQLQTPQGGFASSLDADSDGEEGTFYVWRLDELTAVLGETDGQWAADLLSVTQAGTFEDGKSTLQMHKDPQDWARWLTVKTDLSQAREARTRPARDDKVISSWNAMAIIGLLNVYQVTNHQPYLTAAIEAAQLLRDVHIQSTGEIKRVSLAGVVGKPDGVLEDYAATAVALFNLSDELKDPVWRQLGDLLVNLMLVHFREHQDQTTLRFFDTSDTAEKLFKRPQDLTDGATPAGGAWAAQALAQSSEHQHLAALAAATGIPLIETSPRFAGGWLVATEMVKAPMCTVTGCE